MEPAYSEKGLTFQDSILYLLNEESEKMKGTVRTKDKCPVCNNNFTEIKTLGFICPEHQTTPKHFYVDLFYDSKRLRLFSDNRGQVLDSYQRSKDLLSRINYEIKNHTFDSTRYIKQELEKFYVTNLLDGFLDYKLAGERIAPSYIRHYKRYVGIAKEYFGSKDNRDLRKLDIINYQAFVSETYKFSNKTLKNCLDIFKTFLFYVKNDLEVINTIPHFPEIEVPRPITTWLTPKAQRVAFNFVPAEDKPIVAFLMLSGCRPAEARALKCKDVDLERKLITVSATFSDTVYRQRRKGKHSKDAVIPIHQEVYEYIKNRVESNLPEAFVFVTETGIHYSESRLQRMWCNVRKKAGLDENIRLYDAVRHSFASQLINSGVSIYNVSKLLGHSNIKTTEKYLHTDLELLKVDITNLSLESKVDRLDNKSNVNNQ